MDNNQNFYRSEKDKNRSWKEAANDEEASPEKAATTVSDGEDSNPNQAKTEEGTTVDKNPGTNPSDEGISTDTSDPTAKPAFSNNGNQQVPV